MGPTLALRLPPTVVLADLTVRTPTSSHPPTLPRAVRPSRWPTLELRLYSLAVGLGLGSILWTAVQLGYGHPNYELYAHRLRQGWIPGRRIDTSDPQYSSFRSNLPALLGLLSAQLILRHLLVLLPSSSSSPSLLPLFHAVFALIALSVMHGFNLIKILALVLSNYALSRRVKGSRYATAVSWLFVGAALVASEKTSGFQGWLPQALEKHSGLLPRWHINFNITALRLLSFSLDAHWAQVGYPSPGSSSSTTRDSLQAREEEEVPLQSDLLNDSPSLPPTEKSRVVTPRSEAEYDSLPLYLAYALYTPLYVAGPIMSFNSFASQIQTPPSLSLKARMTYLARFVVSLLCMEVLLHYVYVVAIKDTKGALQGLTAGELGVVGWLNLMVVWLKLLIPWRFFRLWALMDGIDPPENMVRCMANNYSCSGFWRSWHRSYNLWIVRYIYVPLGGSARPLLSTLVVFTFVALWHDLTMRLLVWGWLVTAVVVPELLAKKWLSEKTYGDRPWFRHAVALGGTINVVTMCCANLVGFVLGVEGMKDLVRGIWASWSGVGLAVVSLSGVFAAVQLMIEYREEEKRQGIFRKY